MWPKIKKLLLSCLEPGFLQKTCINNIIELQTLFGFYKSGNFHTILFAILMSEAAHYRKQEIAYNSPLF